MITSKSLIIGSADEQRVSAVLLKRRTSACRNIETSIKANQSSNIHKSKPQHAACLSADLLLIEIGNIYTHIFRVGLAFLSNKNPKFRLVIQF
ncbi:hypothetical protein AcW1_006150 [Taiwanofungus camphoratus]|nr:hypothetical protein AcW2_004912 [Antrodia cinnamomea]KAI0934718.1 hypothetical protein AcV5_006471 [Antrodia cinnamomea]KAI0957912.1 hypothetical protein AcW1_006150 [Antrodia cinnamomea]